MVCLKEEVLAWGKCRGLTIICDWLGVCIWLFPVHPKLTSRAKINKAISYSSGLGNFVLIAIGFGFHRLPGLSAANCGSTFLFLSLIWPLSVCIFNSSWSLILTILSFAGGWPIQEEPKIQIFTNWRLCHCLHGQVYCKIFLPFLLYHHGDHLMREWM